MSYLLLQGGFVDLESGEAFGPSDEAGSDEKSNDSDDSIDDVDEEEDDDAESDKGV